MQKSKHTAEYNQSFSFHAAPKNLTLVDQSFIVQLEQRCGPAVWSILEVSMSEETVTQPSVHQVCLNLQSPQDPYKVGRTLFNYGVQEFWLTLADQGTVALSESNLLWCQKCFRTIKAVHTQISDFTLTLQLDKWVQLSFSLDEFHSSPALYKLQELSPH